MHRCFAFRELKAGFQRGSRVAVRAQLNISRTGVCAPHELVQQEFVVFFFLWCFFFWSFCFRSAGGGRLRMRLCLRCWIGLRWSMMFRAAQEQEEGKHGKEDEGHDPEGFHK